MVGRRGFGAEYQFTKHSYSSLFSRVFNMAASKADFSWTDDELDLLLRCALVFKSKCEHEGLSWEGTKAKYDKIKELVVERYPNKPCDNPNEKFPRIGNVTVTNYQQKDYNFARYMKRNLFNCKQRETT